MQRGYIKIWRKLEDSGLLQMHSTLAMFMYMLMKANHKPSKFGLVDVGRGELISGRFKLAEHLGLSERNVRTCLQHLHDLNMITSKPTNKFTVYTIVNYGQYQDVCIENDQPAVHPETNNRPTTDQQPTTSKELKHLSIKEINTLVTSKLVDDCPHQIIVDAYHEIVPELPQVKVLTDKRMKLLRARWREDEKRQDVEFWRRFFNYVRTSDFLMGKTPSGWQANFEWLINSTNFVKVIEGNYDNR